MTPDATLRFLSFWDAKVTRYLLRVPAGALRTAEAARLAAQRTAIAGLKAGEELAPYADGVTPVQIVGSAIVRAARTRVAIAEPA
jgi:hypothetical protein